MKFLLDRFGDLDCAELERRGGSRREFLSTGARCLVAAGCVVRGWGQDERDPGEAVGMKICLTPGSIGVSANQAEVIDLAVKHGFEAVEPFGGQLVTLDDAENEALIARLKAASLVWGAAGLPVDFRRDEERFQEGLMGLPGIAQALARAGVNRVGTWLSPADGAMSYLQNFKQHARRLKAVARMLGDHGHRLGLEYVGTKTAWTARRYPFIHTMAETADLIGEIGETNVGFVLDSWHWWQAGDGVEEIIGLKPEQVVSVDLNDAPLDVPKGEQIDGQRELPSATGVIDLAGFLKALQRIGYTGPVRPEPFNRKLNEMDNDLACDATIRAMRKAFEAVR